MRNRHFQRVIKEKLKDYQLLVVSNREPYIHNRKEDQIECMRPASGLTVALGPMMRACGGVWIAHGSGSADRETVDNNQKTNVPPENPHYELKRVWLSKEEEEGYYYGFSNEARPSSSILMQRMNLPKPLKGLLKWHLTICTGG